jgi:hypothetical protein
MTLVLLVLAVLMAGLTKKEARLERRREQLGEVIREKERERRAIADSIRDKRERDPKLEERERELDREIRQLLAEDDKVAEELGQRRERRHKVTEKLKKVRKALEDAKQSGGGAAVKWALSQQGVTETPYGSNWGEPVQTWIKNCGYTYAVPWCGCFAREAVVGHGGADIPADHRLGYAGYISDDARNGANGMRAVPFDEAQPGDLLVFWGSAHIGVCVERNGDTLTTIEGNTSSGSSGSQSNGGGVYQRTRYRGDVTTVARPAY